ncbi:hypothetical protein G6F57_015435 [Rhizopus arrhizus]|nr:hypothetical protein G6F57_015435 [Rhizopus arrhizus]
MEHSAVPPGAAAFEQHSASLLHTLAQSHTDLHAALAAKDHERLAAWTETLGAMGATLRQEWQQSGAQAADRQQAISDALAQTVTGLAPGILVLRHAASGAAHCAAARAAPGLHVVNAGDGQHADPLPALALLQAMQDIKQDLTNLAVTLVGDIRHSPVARSVIHAMTTLGVPEVRAVAPRPLLPDSLPQLGVRACASLHEGLQGADVVTGPPLGVAGIRGARRPAAREPAQAYGGTPAALAAANSDVLLLPAGALTPGVEVDGDVAASLPPIEARLAGLQQHLRLAALGVLAGDAP